MPRLWRIEAKNSHIWPRVIDNRCQNACPFFFFFFPVAVSISLNNSISLFSLPATYPSTVTGSATYPSILGFVEKGG